MSYVRANRANWSSRADEYQARHGSSDGTAPGWGIWSIPDEDIGALPQVWDRDIVDLGCGGAEWSAALAQRGGRVIAVDVADGQLAHASRRVRDREARVRLVQASGEQIPLKDGCADVVFSDHGAISWTDPHLTIPEVARVLRPGGWLVCNVSAPWAEVCWDDESGRHGTVLRKSYHGLGRVDREDGGAHFTLGYGEWIRVLRQRGMDVEDLIEMRPGHDATTSWYPLDLQWAQHWPMEHIWKARKRKLPALRAGADLRIARAEAKDLDVLLRGRRPSDVRHRFVREQEQGKSEWLVAWWGDHPVGEVRLAWEGFNPSRRDKLACPEISNLGVDTDVRNRGVATALLTVAEEMAAARGHRSVGLDVEVENLDARRLYERRGYRDWGDGTVPGSWPSVAPDGTETTYHTTLVCLVKAIGA